MVKSVSEIYREMNEAKVREQMLDRMINITMRYVKKKTGWNYWIRPNKEQLKKGGQGTLVLLNNGSALRFNWKMGDLYSISIWNKWKAYSKADRTIELMDTSLTFMLPELIHIIKKPSLTGKFEFYPKPDMVDGRGVIVEAKGRITPEEFYNNAVAMGFNPISMSWDDLSKVADNNNHTIPNKIKDATSQGKGKSRIWNISEFENISNPGSGPDIEKQEIEVTKKDMSTDTDVLKNLDKEAEDFFDAEWEYREDATPDELAQMDKRYHFLEYRLKSFAMGLTDLVCIYGGPGIGKTYTSTKILEEYGITEPMQSRLNMTQLLRTLYIKRKAGDVILFDEADEIMLDDNKINLFKRAFDDKEERFITATGPGVMNVSHMSRDELNELMDTNDELLNSGAGLDDIKIPSVFPFKGRCLFITNMKEDEFNSAIRSRASMVNMDLNAAQVWARIEQVLPYIPIGKGLDSNIDDNDRMIVFEEYKKTFRSKIEEAVRKWNNASGALEKRRLIDPKTLGPDLRNMSRWLRTYAEFKEIPSDFLTWQEIAIGDTGM